MKWKIYFVPPCYDAVKTVEANYMECVDRSYVFRNSTNSKDVVLVVPAAVVLYVEQERAS